MVAARTQHDTPDTSDTAPREATPRHGFEQYARPIDRDIAAPEGRGGAVRMVPLAFHDAFKRPRSMSAGERREFLIKQAALRIAAGLEFRSLRELAREIGCAHTAIDNAVARMCDRLGLRKFKVSEETRARQRFARACQLGRANRETGKICPPPR